MANSISARDQPGQPPWSSEAATTRPVESRPMMLPALTTAQRCLEATPRFGTAGLPAGAYFVPEQI